jgi:predicted metal-dependent peptidase
MSEDNRYDKYVTAPLYTLTRKDPLLGDIIRGITIRLSSTVVPSAGIGIDKQSLEPVMYVNPEYYDSLSNEERVAVYIHEIFHLLNNHIGFRSKLKSPDEAVIVNIAKDLAINQFIENLPEGGVKLSTFKTKEGADFPPNKPWEVYYKLLDVTKDNVNKEALDGFEPMDAHELLEELGKLTEAEQKEFMKKLAESLKRSLEKNSYSQGNTKPIVQKLIDSLTDELERVFSIDEFLAIVKKTLVLPDRKSTWTKPNRRYGAYTPATKFDSVPRVNIYIDCSGSISISELRDFTTVIAKFLDKIPKKLHLGYWHTHVFSFTEIKDIEEVAKGITESGGTDIECVMRHIDRHQANLNVILTDGYYSEATPAKSRDIVYLISKGGSLKHPMEKHGRGTFTLESLR